MRVHGAVTRIAIAKTSRRKMIRETSIEAFNKIKENGLLSVRRMQVYEVLFHDGPLTQNEAHKLLWKLGIRTEKQSITPRFNELYQVGVIKEVGKKVCSVTGNNCILWDVTKNLPVKFEKPIVHKCSACNGTGKIKTSQAMLF